MTERLEGRPSLVRLEQSVFNVDSTIKRTLKKCLLLGGGFEFHHTNPNPYDLCNQNALNESL